MTVTVTSHVQDVTGQSDNAPWDFASVLREGSDDGTIITTRQQTVNPVAGDLTVELDPGFTIVKYAGRSWMVTVPETDTGLWTLIEAAVAVPPDTDAAQLFAAIESYLTENGIGPAIEEYLAENPPAASWDALSDMPNFVAAGDTAAAARGAIGAVGADDLPDDSLPDQTGQSGKFLTTNGTAPSWGAPAGGIGSLADLGVTATAAELNHVDGVTSAIQGQLDSKAADSAVVKLTGDQDIAGEKTFTGDVRHEQQWTTMDLVNVLNEQYSGAGFKVYNDASSVTGPAGVQFVSGISDSGATETFLEVATVDRTGAYIGILYQFNLDTGKLNLKGVLDLESHKVINVTDGTDPGDAVNRGQLDGKLDKSSSTSRLYGVNGSGAQTNYQFTTTALTISTVPMRVADGALHTGPATDTTHATPKSYVDTGDTAAKARANHTGTQAISTVTNLQTSLDAKESTANKNQANGYAGLDGGGKVLIEHLPASLMQYQGTWNAFTNTPTLDDGVGSVGDVYRVSTAGTKDLGSGDITFAVGDYVICNASLAWEKSDTTDAVASVAGLTGNPTASALRAAMSLVPGTDIQAYDAELAAIAGLNSAANKLPYFTGSGAAALADLSAFGRTLTALADAAAGRTALSVPPNARAVGTQHSLTGGGDLTADRTLSLVGDTASPGNAKLYGTNGSGVRGWYDQPGGGGGGGALSGTYASLPAAGTTNRLYYCTDNGNVYRDNGASWDLVSVAGSGIPGVEPPSASWTTTTLGSATIAADKGGRLVTVPTAIGINIRGEYRTLSPASNYTVTAYIESTADASVNFWRSGILLRDAGGQYISFGHGGDGAAKSSIAAVKYSSQTAATASYAVVSLSDLPARPNWFRIRDNGTTRFFEYSLNGIDWLEFVSGVRTDFLTATQVGWGASNSTGKVGYCRLHSFSVT